MTAPRALPAALAAAIFLAGGFFVLSAGGRRSDAGFEPGSVFNETPAGASTALHYLRARRAGGAGILSRRVAAQALPSDAVLFRLRPRRTSFAASMEEKTSRPPRPKPRPLLTPAEEAWLRGGGRLVLALDEDYGPLQLPPARSRAALRKTFPLWPGVTALEPAAPLRELTGPAADEAHAVFTSGPARVLSRLTLGRGEVVLLAAPELLENDRLARADHLKLLEALAPEGRPVLFDEWAHGLGHDEGLFRLLLAWGFGPALAIGTLAFALALWRGRARLGPPQEDALDARSEAVDLVDSLSQLYDRALSRREAASLQLEGFARAVALRTGLRGATLERRVRELLAGPPPPPATSEIPARELTRRIALVNAGYRRLEEHVHTRRRP